MIQKPYGRITSKTSIIDWADEIAGDTHIGKQNQMTITKKGKRKTRRECLEVLNPLLVQDVAHRTKNPTTTLMPPMMVMEEMELAGSVLHYLVAVHNS
jgi:hypothetical protein